VSEPALSLSTVEGLVELTRDLAATTDLQDALDLVCRALVDVADFQLSAINLVTESGDLQVVAVAGSPQLAEALLGVVAPRHQWDAELASCVRHHGLQLSRESDDDRLAGSWTSDDQEYYRRGAGDPQAWQPDYALFVPLSDSSGEMIGVVSVDMPVSGLIPEVAQAATVEIVARAAERAIAAARLLARSELNERIYRLAFDTAATLTAIADVDGRFVDANRAFREVLPDVHDAASFDRAATVHDGGRGLADALDRVLGQGQRAATFVVDVRVASDVRWFRVTVRGIGGVVAAPERAVCTIVDISVERREQLRHRRDAELDPLTGLLNRRGARGAMDALVARLAPGAVVAVLACDLDDFKAVNDDFGHQVGDEVLVQAAQRMRAALPDGSVAIRLGGDEFLLITECATLADAEAAAEAVVASMRCGVVVDEQLVPATISVGLAAAGGGSAEGLSGLVDAADRALYEAKAGGRTRWALAPQALA
jgi:diguanylate cyclase (GGDEF)-like protein